MMHIQVNGETKELSEGLSLAALVKQLELAPGRLACEVNLTVVRKNDYEGTILKDGDVVEIVQMIGGG